MTITTDNRSFFIFDLDDTLFPEIEYLRSAFRHIALKYAPFTGSNVYEEMWQLYKSGTNVFKWFISAYQDKIPGITIDLLLQEYRNHNPVLQLPKETVDFLEKLRHLQVPLGLITDGRSITQRNKLKALGIEQFFSDIIISEEFGSEKPDERNYRYFPDKYPGKEFYFFADNTTKDFIIPSKFGWTTICIKDNGENIHRQQLDREPVPGFIISSFREVELT
jgi:putative hydrolase of the HAD superfamily